MVDAARVDRNFQNACSCTLHEFALDRFKEQQRLAMNLWHQTRAPSRESGENRGRIETLTAGN